MNKTNKKRFFLFLLLVVLLAMPVAGIMASSDSAPATAAATSTMPWWGWPLILFTTCFVLGILAVLGGIGGGVLFVPIVSSFFPFHMDFVRGAGLMVALTGSLAATPGLLKKRFAKLRLALPLALIASVSSIVGAIFGLALPASVVQTALGITILSIVLIMALAKKSEIPGVEKNDRLAETLQLSGIYHDPADDKKINYNVHRTARGMSIFAIIGFLAGMFGLGAGWANVPALNLLMGVPLKISVATSKFMLSIADTSAAWIYLNSGAILPMLVVPSVLGIMLGSKVGVKLLVVAKPKTIRYTVIGLLLFSGLRSLLKGLNIWP